MVLSAILIGLLAAQASSPAAPAPVPAVPAAGGPAAPVNLAATIAQLGSFDLATRTRAAQTLRRTDPTAAARALASAAERHPDEYVRFRAFVLLSAVDTPTASGVARAVLADRNDRLRMAAYQWFERYPDPEILPTLIEALPREGSEFVRPALTRALAAHGSDSRVQATLAPLVMKGEDFFRGSVITALGDYPARYALQSIVDVARLDGPLQDDAVTAIGRIGDESARGTLVALQASASRDVQPSISAALCLLGVDCPGRLQFLRDSAAFAVAHEGQLPLLRGTMHALGVLAIAGRGDAMAAMMDAANGAPAHAREAISFALAAAAMRAPDVLLTTLEGRRDALQVGELLLEGFDILSEDFEEEQFFAAARRAYWAAAAGTPRRAAAEALIQKLEF
jgi:HEAT repeat protein